MATKNSHPIFFIFMCSWLMVSCTSAPPSKTSQLESPASSDSSHALAELSLAKGTTWVYSYAEYEPTALDPTQVITATYLFTETVIDTQTRPPFFIAHVQREERLVNAPPDWNYTASSRPNEFWYVANDQQIYESLQKLDLTNIQTETLILAYDFPLSLGRSWCPSSYIKGEKVQDCTAAGKRTVVSQEKYNTPAGEFDNCYKITEDVNSGGVTRWLCKNIGIVAQKYDHGGTRFGFQQTLVNYSSSSP
jgi:hypothetical protein